MTIMVEASVTETYTHLNEKCDNLIGEVRHRYSINNNHSVFHNMEYFSNRTFWDCFKNCEA